MLGRSIRKQIMPICTFSAQVSGASIGVDRCRQVLSQVLTNPVSNFGLTLLEVKPVSDLSFWPEIRVRQVLVFSPLVTNLFQHGFRGVKPSKMVRF